MTEKFSPEADSLRQDLAAKGVRYAIASYVDMHGASKSKMVPLPHLGDMLGGSELFTGAALDGVPQEISDEEVAAVPDPASCTILPWQREIAWFASDLWTEGKPFEPCSRQILGRVLDRFAGHGLKANFGIEAEFFVLKKREDGSVVPVSNQYNLAKPAYDTSRLIDNFHWLDELVTAMNDMGWDVYSFDHEDGIGQFEIDFMYAEAKTMADRFVFLRWMAQSIAREHGYIASFMPKPFGDRTGSGAHYNMSLASLESGENMFKDPNDPRGCKLSELGYHFVGGVVKHLPAIMAVVAPWVNSYKRLIKQGSMSGFTWAPVFACYGNNNRTNAVRIPLAGGRMELRAADSACNPYLGAAMVLAAGLEGIEQKIDPGEPNRDNMYLKTQAELDALGIGMLPRTLDEAVDAFEADPLSKQVFGEKMYDAWVAFKREEWLSYLNHVSDWETKRYLEFF